MNRTPALDDDDARHALPLGLLADAFPQTIVALPSGARVAVRIAGEARADSLAIVLLHGIGSGAASWLYCALALAPAAHVVAWDAPGYGESTPLAPPAPCAADYAERLGELLIELGLRDCVLVGHSLGALMAAAYAHRSGAAHTMPDGESTAAAQRVRRLLLISPARGYGAPEQAAAGQKVRDERRQALQTLGIAELARRSPERMLSAQADDAARAWVRWNSARLHPGGYAQAVQMLCGDVLGRYTAVAMPVEVHCGDHDIVTPPAACREVAASFSASFMLIANAGHASPIEQPDAVAAVLARAAHLALDPTDSL